jgi:hypothetical protein
MHPPVGLLRMPAGLPILNTHDLGMRVLGLYGTQTNLRGISIEFY